MSRMRLVAYYVYVYAVPEAYTVEGGSRIPRCVCRRLVSFR